MTIAITTPRFISPPNVRTRPCQCTRGAWEDRGRSYDGARVPRARGRRPIQDRVPNECEERAGEYDRAADAEAIGERACEDGGEHRAEVWRNGEELRVRGGEAETGDDRGEEEGGRVGGDEYAVRDVTIRDWAI